MKRAPFKNYAYFLSSCPLVLASVFTISLKNIEIDNMGETRTLNLISVTYLDHKSCFYWPTITNGTFSYPRTKI